MRIVSLLASGTEIVCALGLDNQLVGISHECDFPPTILNRPRVSRPRFDPTVLTSGEIDRAVRKAMEQHGSVYELDAAGLRRLAPDLVITQAVCEVCAVPTSLAEQAVGALDGEVEVLSLDAHTIEEILQMVVAVAAAAGVPARGEVVAESLRGRVAGVRARTSGIPRPTVLAIEWLEPVFAPGHWVPEMIEYAGGRNLVGDVRRPSLQLSWEGVRGLDPDVLIVMPCGFGLAQAREAADRHAEELMSVAERAIVSGRAFVVDGSSYFNRSGPRVADGVEILGRLLHPERAPQVELSDRAVSWRPGPVTEPEVSAMQTFRYDPRMVQPMREELTQIGFRELRTPDEVDQALGKDQQGTALVVVNSVCGCAAGSARPGVRRALEKPPRPDRLVTVFAGMEVEAVDRARSYFVGYPPSSPQMALFRNGDLVWMLERHDIEGRTPEEVAVELKQAFTRHCSGPS